MPNTIQLKRPGQIVREARQQKKWTLQELADNSRVGHSYLSNIERGYVNPNRGPVTPSDDILAAISQTLDIPLTAMHTALGRIEDDTDAMPIEYAPILDELRSAFYDGGLDSGDVYEITEIIRMKHRLKAEKQGRE